MVHIVDIMLTLLCQEGSHRPQYYPNILLVPKIQLFLLELKYLLSFEHVLDAESDIITFLQCKWMNN